MDVFYLALFAFGGGVFASLIGGTNAFVFTGITGLLGLIMNLAGGGDLFLTTIPMGPLFSPNVAFNGGVVALALYKRVFDTNDEVDGTNTFLSLFPFKNPVVLLAGGITGSLGFLFNYFIVNVLNFSLIDTVALTIVVFNVLTRLVIGKSGLVPKVDNNRYVETNKNILFTIVWSLGLSLVIAYVAITLNSELVGFYLSAFSLVFLSLGKKIPGTHHITLITGIAALKFANPFIGALFGIVAAVLGEYFDVTFNKNADTLIDMPSAIIAGLSFIILFIL